MRAFVSLCGVLLVIATAIVSARGQEGVLLEESQLDNRLRALWRTTDAIEASGFVEEIDRLDLSAERRLEVMVQILDHPTVSVRVSAFHRIGQLGVAASSAAPRLLKALSGEDSERVAAIYALNEIAEPTPEIIQALLAIPADNQTDYVRLAMLRTFRGWGPKARGAIPFAESLLDHESVDIQVEAFESLGRIADLAPPVAE